MTAEHAVGDAVLCWHFVGALRGEVVAVRAAAGTGLAYYDVRHGDGATVTYHPMLVFRAGGLPDGAAGFAPHPGHA